MLSESKTLMELLNEWDDTRWDCACEDDGTHSDRVASHECSSTLILIINCVTNKNWR